MNDTSIIEMSTKHPDVKVFRKDPLISAQLPDGTSPNSVPLKEYNNDEEYQEELKRAAKIQQENSGEDWTPAISIEELCKKEYPPQQWTVENLFARGTINQISAPPNQWKTWITLHMAISIAHGEPVFNKFRTEKQGVLLINEEGPEYMLRERFLKLSDAARGLSLYIHAEKGIKLEDEKVDELLKEMKEKNLGVVIFDSFSVVHTADENSAQQMNAVFEQMKRFIREGITVIFTNHHRKKPRGGYKDDPQEQTRGSTVINAVPAGHITCEEKKEGEKLYVIIRQAKLKSAKKIDPFLVAIREEDDKIKFEFEGNFEEGVDAATKLNSRIYEIILNSDRWIGVKDLMTDTEKSERSIRTQLAVLLADKQIRKERRSVLQQRGESVSTREGASKAEMLYFKIVAEEETGTP